MYKSVKNEIDQKLMLAPAFLKSVEADKMKDSDEHKRKPKKHS